MRQVIGFLIDQEKHHHQESMTSSSSNTNAGPSMQADDDDNDDDSVEDDDDDCDDELFVEWKTDPFATELVDGEYAPNVAWHHLVGAEDDDLEMTDFIPIELLGRSRREDMKDKDYMDQRTKSSSSAQRPLTAATFPTLQELVIQFVSRKFINRARKNEQAYRKRLQGLLSTTSDRVGDMFGLHIEKLLNSPEAALLRLLLTILITTKQKLSMMNQEHLEDAKKCQKQIIQDANKERAMIKLEWFAKREAILNEHQAFVDQYANNINDADDDNGRKVLLLCHDPNCRSVFNLGELAEKKRCSIPNCMATHSSCGCNMKTCRRCKRTICKFHVKSHRTACIDKCQRICGFQERTGLIDFRYCQQERPLERIAECEDCGVKCCLDNGNCSTHCANCNTVYCTECVPFLDHADCCS